jgi:hypothetical protein
MAKIQCQICGVWFSRITENHVRVHHIDMEEYRRRYIATSPGEQKNELARRFEAKEIMEHAIHLISPEELQDVVASSNLTIFSRQARQSVVACAMAMQHLRLELCHKSATILGRIQEKFLKEPWRLERNEDGTPLANKDLVEIWHMALRDVTDASREMTQLLYASVQDNKSVLMRPGGAQDKPAFSGTGDVPPGIGAVPAHEREKVRILVEKLAVLVAEKQREMQQQQQQESGGEEEDDPPPDKLLPEEAGEEENGE